MSTPSSTPPSVPEVVVQQYETENEPSPRNALVRNQPSTNTRSQSYTESPKSRFQFAAKRVINIHRLASLAPEFGFDWSPGDEQGVDISMLDGRFESVMCRCDITVVDYSQERVQVHSDLTNSSLSSFLARKRPSWSKVRWINVNGLSWDVIKPLATHYELHPLAVEDLFHVPQRTKVDYYTDHMFISLILHTLQPDNEDTPFPAAMAEPLIAPPPLSATRTPSGPQSEGYTNSKYYEAMKKFRKHGVHVALEQTFLFMVAEGKHANTLITFFQNSGHPVTEPVEERLRQPKTLLRASTDVSLLMQAVLDAIVDHTLPIADSYREQIAELEGKILVGAMMSYTRELHLITGELTLLKRTLAPIQNLIHTLRGHDERNPVSSLARTYFGDVLDHCTTTVENLDMMIAVSDNLINMVFNTVAYETNESMRKLSIISIIFLPITFLAGVYGMNFTDFPALNQNVIYFWKLCAGVLAVMVIVFTASYWERLFNNIWRRIRRRIWWKDHGTGHHHLGPRRGLMRSWGKGVMVRGL